MKKSGDGIAATGGGSQVFGISASRRERRSGVKPCSFCVSRSAWAKRGKGESVL